ncbi:MAG: NAD(+) diphosphatase [Hyphomonadaceae bacterium]
MPLPLNPNTFANYPLDRAAHLRKEPEWLHAALTAPETRFTPFAERKPLLRPGDPASPCWLDPAAAEALAPGAPVFLGLDEAGHARFAFETTADLAATPLAGAGEFTEMRAAAMQVAGGDSAILGTAKSIFEWHARHRFCANCGQPTQVVEGGWKRECAACGVEHFPRVDPVVIMLATWNGHCLLGRGKRFANLNMYSALAGYIEPGESIEEACARELFEEAGVRAVAVRYHSAQPWPFPSTLMIGLFAEVEDGAIAVDKEELEDARWFSRDDAQAALERRHPSISVPQRLAIAHQLIKTWAYG